MPLSVGTKPGHYEVVSLIGQCGMGEGYGARDTTRTFVLALIEGPTRADRIQASPPAFHEVLGISRKIIEGMQSTR